MNVPYLTLYQEALEKSGASWFIQALIDILKRYDILTAITLNKELPIRLY